jgi:FixJ family two-component response regulator
MNEATVLCVDDEIGILNSLKRLLRKEPYALLTASSGQEGLALMEKQPAQVVISDQRMPGMTGIEFLQKVRERWLGTVRVVLSGYADIAAVVDAINKGQVYRFLTKPWNDDELKVAIRQCWEQYELRLQHRAMSEQIRRQNAELSARNIELGLEVSENVSGLRLAHLILENLPLGVIGVDDTGTVVLANQRAQTLLCSSTNQLLGCSLPDCLPLAEAQLVACAVGKPCVTCRLQLKQRTILLSASSFKSGDGAGGKILVVQEAGHAEGSD